MARQGAGRSKERREAEAEARREATKRAQRIRRWVIGAVVSAVVLGGITWAVTRPPPPELEQVETFPDQGALHIDPTSPAPQYNSDPPTSGPHSAQSAPCGIYREPIPDVIQVHDLEHGVVVIQYDPSIPAEDRDALEDAARRLRTHVLVAPREQINAPIVLTAWTKRLALEEPNRSAIEAFYALYAQNGPERGVPCPIAVDEGRG